jgi:hypothetical protein
MKAKLATIVKENGGAVKLARKLHVHFSAVYRWIAGTHRPGFDVAERITEIAHRDGYAGVIWPVRK